jgi:uncharacterized protein YbjT (DUF2867 family)
VSIRVFITGGTGTIGEAVIKELLTTKLYDRRGQKVLLEDMERIRY